MESSLHEGETVLVDTNRHNLKKNGVYIFRSGDELYIKRIERLLDSRIKFKSDNKDYETFIKTREEIEREIKVFGMVIWRAGDFI